MTETDDLVERLRERAASDGTDLIPEDYIEAATALTASQETIDNLREENERLRKALQAVVDDYPVAAGTSRSADPDMQGYGSIKAARAAIAKQEGA